MRNRKIIGILIIVLIFIFLLFGINKNNSIKQEDFNLYIQQLEETYENNTKEILNHLKNQDDIENTKYNNIMNSFLKIHYSYINRNFKYVKDKFIQIEKKLIELNLNDELLHIYSIIASIYTTEERYEMAYIYTEKANILAEKMYHKFKLNKDKKDEYSNTLLAINYMKVRIALRMELYDLADKDFIYAEEIRKQLNRRERVDIYSNILAYYVHKKDYPKVQEYYNKIIKMEDKTGRSRISTIMSLISMNLDMNDIDAAIENVKEIEKNQDKLSNILQADLYIIYSKIYLYCGQKYEAIKSLDEAYNILEKEEYYMYKKSDIVKLAIDIIEKIPDYSTEELWHKRYIEINENIKSKKDSQFLIGTINDLELQNIKETNKNLKIKSNFTLIILIIILAIFIISLLYIDMKNNKDVLTSVYNRRKFEKDYNKLLSKNQQFYLCIIDIDNFKYINDNYGHDIGDTVLSKMCSIVRCKINKKMKIYRYGGEEFVILIDESDSSNVLKYIEKIRKAVEIDIFKNNIKVTISAGIANYNDSGIDTLKEADEKLYISKRTGKNKITI